MDEQQTSSKKKIIGISVGILLIALIGIVAYILLQKKDEGGNTVFTSLFGNLGVEVPREQGGQITPGNTTTNSGAEGVNGEEPLFRKLTALPTAGATTVTRDGKTVVRFIAKENAFIYDVDPKTGVTTQLTNTTIPRVYEASFGLNGNAVVIRYLSQESASRDTIKTYLAYLSLPDTQVQNSSSSIAVLGSLVGDFLPDNISEISISPDGKTLFYLRSLGNSSSGTIVDIATKSAKEVLRSSFSEWLPQLLDNGMIVLTTKPSAAVDGFSYLYNPTDRSFTRILRKIPALTTLGVGVNKRMLFSENYSGKITLGVYDKTGYAGDEGTIEHTINIPLAALAEKCVWSSNMIRIFCGAQASTPKAQIPDEWYQGTLSFEDLFWTTNTDTSEITFLSDPSKEPSAGITMDVYHPFIDPNEDHFFFMNKNDMSLWSMRIMKEKFMASDEILESPNTPALTPDELKDAMGSTNTTNTKPQ